MESKFHHNMCVEFISSRIANQINFNNLSCYKIFASNWCQLNFKWTCIYLNLRVLITQLVLILWIYNLILNAIESFWFSNHTNFDQEEMKYLIYIIRAIFQNGRKDVKLWSFFRKSLCFGIKMFMSIMVDPRGQVLLAGI